MFAPDVLSAIITAAFTLVGVAAGAYINKSASQNDFYRRELIESYSQFIVLAVAIRTNHSESDIQKLISAGKRLQLLCTQSSSDKVNQILSIALHQPFDTSLFGIVLQSLEEEAKRDIKQYH